MAILTGAMRDFYPTGFCFRFLAGTQISGHRGFTSIGDQRRHCSRQGVTKQRHVRIPIGNPRRRVAGRHLLCNAAPPNLQRRHKYLLPPKGHNLSVTLRQRCGRRTRPRREHRATIHPHAHTERTPDCPIPPSFRKFSHGLNFGFPGRPHCLGNAVRVPRHSDYVCDTHGARRRLTTPGGN